jgi:hypothetical protein
MYFLRSRYFLTGLVVLQALFTLLIKPPKEKMLVSDAVHYHSWLSSAIIKQDLSLSFLSPDSTYDTEYAHNLTDEGVAVFKMPPGVAMLQFPFFLVAHAISLATDQPADGYSNTYQLAIRFAGIFYFILALIFLQKVLRKRFEEAEVNLTIAVLSLGSNLYYYAFMESGMSHVYTFFLFSILVWIFNKEKIRALDALLIGTIAGMLFLVRNSNVFLLLYFPLLQFVGKSVKSNFFTQSRLIITAAIPAAILVSLHIGYLHWATNQWMLSAYFGERFFWTQPEVLKFLFSFKKGWFVYSPLMLFVLPGLWLMFRKREGEMLPLLITLLLSVYVFSAWWCWWYGGSFGMRAMIDLYALLALPIAHMMQWIVRQSFSIRQIAFRIILFGVMLNVFQTFQYQHAIIHWDGMSFKLYKSHFYKIRTSQIYPGLDVPDYERSKRERLP